MDEILKKIEYNKKLLKAIENRLDDLNAGLLEIRKELEERHGN